MAIPMLPDTREALGPNAAACENRSLYQDRFADAAASDKTRPTRKEWLEGVGKRTVPGDVVERDDWIPAGSVTIHARLQARLMVNMSGGVMENAGLCLDRYGLPYIPGAAVKGCARRMALQALHDWVAAGTDRPAADDICTPCCEGFENPVEMLVEIAHVFGWVSLDWSLNTKDKNGVWQSEFAWACAGEWSPPNAAERDAAASRANQTLIAVAVALCTKLHITVPDKQKNTPWKVLPDFAGSVSFLPAFPNRDPGIELDIVTCHHPKFYASTQSIAPDTEDPNPVIFPAIKPQVEGDCFHFSIISLRNGSAFKVSSSEIAKRWLSEGLVIFGIGGKTNAGHGSFDLVAAPAPPPPASIGAGTDYANETIFQNSVISLLGRPGEWQKLHAELKKLESPQNQIWVERLTDALRGGAMRETRKKLKEKPWFRDEWLPDPQAR